MSSTLETLGGGGFETGFMAGDSSRILMDEGDPISFEQFCQYSSDVAVEVLKDLGDSNEYLECVASVEFVATEVRKVPVIPVGHAGISEFEPVENLIEMLGANDEQAKNGVIWTAINAALSNNANLVTTYYQENPFEYEDGVIIINGSRRVNRIDFFDFVLSYLNGGFFGWKKEFGVIPAVPAAVDKLLEAIKTS